MNNRALERFKIYLKKNPRKLFLVDGFGALTSAFLLGIVLVRFERIFGIPSSTLYFLASLPILFSAFDLFSYNQDDDKIAASLKVIAKLNLIYCFLSIGLAFYHYQKLTYFGWSYILLEIVIIVVLARFEMRFANMLTEGKLTSNTL